MDPEILLFRRQYIQIFEPDFLAWPPKQLLRNADVQEWLYDHCFNSDQNTYLPPERYQYRVLKHLLAKIEQAVEDPEEDEISDNLMTHLSTLISSNLPDEMQAAQQRSYVTFSCPLPSTSSPSSSSSDVIPSNGPANEDQEQTITLLERRNLISGSSTTGFRTWEAALHLGSYLLTTPEARSIIRDKNVFELGAGTGFLSILCGKVLDARRVTATDGDEAVVETLKENLFLNGLDEQDVGGKAKVATSVLRWGRGLRGTWVEEEFEESPVDVVLGADITYDKTAISALVTTLRYFFDLRPTIQVLISGAVRNAETFEHFRWACERSKFTVEEIDFEARPMREQRTLFYGTAVPLKILLITKAVQEA